MTKLCSFLKQKGLSISVVSQELGISRQALSMYGTGQRGMNAKTYKRIAAAMTSLGVETTARDIMVALEDGSENNDEES